MEDYRNQRLAKFPNAPFHPITLHKSWAKPEIAPIATPVLAAPQTATSVLPEIHYSAGQPDMETYNGHVRTPADAIILFEACRLGLLPRVQRRLSEKERQSIKSGSVFV